MSLRIVSLSIILLLSSAAVGWCQDLSACGPMEQKLRLIKHPAESGFPEPGAGKAMVYVFCTGRYKCGNVQGRIGLNGKWVAAITTNTYARFEVDPGTLRFCQKPWGGRPSANNFVFVTAEPGKRYYLRAKLDDLNEVTEQEAVKELRKCKLSTFERK